MICSLTETTDSVVVLCIVTMPTVLLLDCGLSMGRLVGRGGEGERVKAATPRSPQEITLDDDTEIMHLAQQGAASLLATVETNCRLEHVAILTFSSCAEVVAPFSRDLGLLRSKLAGVSCQDKSLLEVGLGRAVSLVMEEWGGGATASLDLNLVIVTDGSLGHGPMSLGHLANVGPTELKLPLPFPCSVSVICLADRAINPHLKLAKAAYMTLFTKLGVPNTRASFHCLESGTLTEITSESLFTEVAQLHYTQWTGRLLLGADMSVKVQLCPPPKNFSRARDFTVVSRELGHTLAIQGYLALSDIASPPVFSRHLVLPLPSSPDTPGPAAGDTDPDSKSPNICVFLHGALKVENMCALVEVGEDWYGVLYSWSDNKKKSSLMISLFEPGLDAVPWLGNLERLGPASGLNETTQSPFPVKSERRPSYSSAPVVWIKQSGIQSDIQKVLRHARKLPDKTQQFYKELNRLKKAAVCLGFYELLDGVAQICERECGLLPANVSPDCAIQLTYVAQVLRSQDCYSSKQIIQPKLTHFNQGKF